LTLIFLLGVLIGVMVPNTGSLCQYFNPTHSLLDATLLCVTGSAPASSSTMVGWPSRRWGGGAVGPPRTMDEMSPDCWSAMQMFKCNFVCGIEARARRALFALFRDEHTCARLTRDMSGIRREWPRTAVVMCDSLSS